MTLMKRRDGLETGAQREEDQFAGHFIKGTGTSGCQGLRVGEGLTAMGKPERIFLGMRELVCILIMVVAMSLSTCQKLIKLSIKVSFTVCQFKTKLKREAS